MKLVLDQVNRGLIARGLGQSWFAPAPRSLHISRVVRGQVLTNMVQPVHRAIGDSIRDPIIAVIRAEFSGGRQKRIASHAKSQPRLKPLQRPHSQGLKQTLDLVGRSRDTQAVCQSYLVTSEAAAYLRRSVSWLLRIGQIPYLPGKPNLYAIRDLDDFFERNKHIPRS